MFNLIDEITEAQVFLERSEAALGEITEEYFSLPAENNPNTPQGRENIIVGFEQNRVFAEIARDYVIQTRRILDGVAGMIHSSAGNGLTGEVCVGGRRYLMRLEPKEAK